jgi:DNA-binding winged helix-turn-helix (wHTH) protein/tetratricopeptide (TPR) repeat protein
VGTYRFAEFVLDEGRHELRFRGENVRLAPQPFRLLAALVSRRGEVVRRDELERALWAEGTFVDAEAGLNFCVRSLRRALAGAAGGADLVETVPRVGYRLRAEVHEVEAGVGARDGASSAGATGPSAVGVSAGDRTVVLGARPRRLAAIAVGGAATLLVLAASAQLLSTWREDGAARSRRVTVTVRWLGDEPAPSMARAFESEVVAALAEGARGRAAIAVAPYGGSAAAGHVLEIVLLAIPAGIRADVRLLRAADVVDWQWIVEMEPGRWFHARSTIAEGVAREAVTRLWPRVGGDALLADEARRVASRLDDDDMTALDATLSAAERLVARRPRSAAAHSVLARARLASWDAAGAESAARRALELDDDFAEAERSLAAALTARGAHREAIAAAFRARKLAPLDPGSHAGLARALLFAGRTEDVVRASDAGLALFPDLESLWRWRYLAHLELGDAARAGEALAEVLRLSPGADSARARTALAGATLEDLRAEWRAELDGSRGLRVRSAYSRAALHALLGERSEAMAELERAIDARERAALFSAVAPWFSELRGDARFESLVRRVTRADVERGS